MKKVLVILLLSTFLAGCTFPGAPVATSEPTMSDIEMSTRVAQLLTVMPTFTPAIQQQATKPPQITLSLENPTSTLQMAMTSTPESEEKAVTPTPTGTMTDTATATQTGTATVNPTVYPSGDPRAGLGEADWADAMNDGSHWPIDEDTWSIGRIDSGMLVITGKQKINAWRMSATQKISDAYIEVAFKTDTCSGKDAYGIFFRVPVLNQPDQGYLYGLTCDGQYFLKEWNGKVSPNGSMTTLVDYISNENIIAGSNQINRIGMMAVGKRLLLYINGSFVREASDDTYSSGYFGLFVNPVSTVPLSIRADEVNYWLNPTIPTTTTSTYTPSPTITTTGQVTNNESSIVGTATVTPTLQSVALSSLLLSGKGVATATQSPTTSPTISPTPLGTNDIRTILGEPEWKDTLDNSLNWVINADTYSTIKMADGNLIMTGLQKTPAWRLAGTNKLSDAYIEATIKTDNCSGTDSYGVIFHVPTVTNPNQGYLLGVTCDGKYFLWKWDGKAVSGAQLTKIIDYTSDYLVNSGVNAVNRIGVLTVGDKIQIYLNGMPVREITDNTYTNGLFGVFVRPQNTTKYTIRVDETSYWTD